LEHRLQTIADEIYGYLKKQVKNVPTDSKLKEFIILSGNKDGEYVKRRLLNPAMSDHNS
jgi:hypothetical protein